MAPVIAAAVTAALQLTLETISVWREHKDGELTLEAAMLRLKAAQDRYAAARAAWEAAGHDEPQDV
jgi:hypothetical protein